MFEAAADLLHRAVAAGAFPGATIEVGTARRPVWQFTAGALTFDATAPPVTADTVYDLASLTKVLATTPLIAQMVERGALGLDDPISDHLPPWHDRRADRVTIRDLLSHSSGLPGWRPLFEHCTGHAAFEAAILATPLEYAPRAQSVYSDLGFMLLGFLLDTGAPLATRFDTLLTQAAIPEPLQYRPPALWRRRIAPTEIDHWRGRLLVGEVHDENAAALGGVAGHAGLFGTAAAVGACARHVLQVLDGRSGVLRRDTLEQITRCDGAVPGSSRALGWDTMRPTSSCGTKMSARAFGHTGFTGTSLWIDPEQEVYVVLLTNRVHPTRTNQAITTLRPAVHDAIMTEWPKRWAERR